ncbi:hypothetical protein ABIF93_010152 [Bradyrhizobium japonicum]
MRGADLVTEPPCKHQDNCEREYVHELCSHEHLITYGDRMTEITKNISLIAKTVENAPRAMTAILK